MPGPPPKRSSERRRANKVEITRAPSTAGRLGPEPPSWLSGLALEFYESLRVSGQAVYYTPSDWTAALIVCKGIEQFEAKPSAFMLGQIMSAMGSLLATEGERRRLRIELERGDQRDVDEDAAVASLAKYRRQVGA